MLLHKHLMKNLITNNIYMKKEIKYKICEECGASDSQIEVDYDEYKKIKKKFNLVGIDFNKNNNTKNNEKRNHRTNKEKQT